MKLNIPKNKNRLIMCRFPEDLFHKIVLLAQENETDNVKIIRALVEKVLCDDVEGGYSTGYLDALQRVYADMEQANIPFMDFGAQEKLKKKIDQRIQSYK